MALAIGINAGCAVEVIAQQVQVPRRFVQTAEHLASRLRLSYGQDGPYAERAKHQRETILVSPPVAVLEHAALHIGERVQTPSTILVQTGPNRRLVGQPLHRGAQSCSRGSTQARRRPNSLTELASS